MDTRKLVKTKGIVLSEVNFSESDKMLTLLTPDLGKVSCVARGARRSQSKILASAQIFAFSDLVLFRGSGESYYINSADLIEPFYSVRNDYDRLECAMNCVKFIKNNIQENQGSVYILKLLLNTLYLLSVGEKKMDFVKNVFDLKSICILGYTPDLSNCKVCGCENDPAGFSMKKSGIVCKNCSFADKSIVSLSVGTISAVKYIIQSDLKRLFSFEVSEDVLREISLFNKVYMQDKLEN